jgi:hypothetical protein
MRKALIVVIIVMLGIGGYLGWDWYDKTKKQQLEPSMTLYYWTDSNGEKHISDAPPPENARNVTTDKGYKHIRTPLIVTLRNKVIEFYKRTKKKLLKPGKTKKK